MKKIKISIAMLKQKFHPCELGYILSKCHGRCCESANGIKVFIDKSEEEKFINMGAKIENNFIEPDRRGLCPFKTDDGLCSIHEDKPMGCRFSPFTLNNNDTLIVRNRYRLLICYKCDGSIPAYQAHKWSLTQILGIEVAEKVIRHMEENDSDIIVEISEDIYNIMKNNNQARNKK